MKELKNIKTLEYKFPSNHYIVNHTKIFKTVFVMAVLMIVNFNWVNAQEEPIEFERFISHDYSDDFELFKHMDDIDIYFKYADCGDPANGFYPEYLLFKLVNTSDQSQHVTWWWKLYYDGKLATDNYVSDEDKVELILNPGEIVQADCKKNTLSIFVQIYDSSKGSILTEYYLDNLAVEPIH